MLTHPSWFAVARNRMLNTATFHVEIVGQILLGLKEYYKDKTIALSIPVDNLQISYESYKTWLSNGHDDVNISVGNFSNHQLFWITIGLEMISREEELAELDKKNHRDKYFHVKFKQHQGFQEAFNCPLTPSEKKELQECDDCKQSIYTNDIQQQILLFMFQSQ